MTRFQQWHEAFAALKLTERRLIFIATAVLLPYLTVLFLLEPGWRQVQQLQQQLRQTKAQFQALEQQSGQLLLSLQQDPNRQIKAQLASEAQRQTELSQQIRQLTGRYVGPEQMLSLLQDVLQQSPGVQLQQLSSKQPEPVRLPVSSTATNAADTQPMLYRHITVLTFHGDYLRLQQFLQQLEALPWQLHWRQLDYQVLQHPQAELTLQLETISEQADYLRI
jgi:MSHA biogenesis protein MshJ